MKIEIELDVFSGRPNPTWVLEDAVAAKVMGLLNQPKNEAVPSGAPTGLGYRGLILRIHDAPASVAQRIRVFRKISSTGEGPEARHHLVQGLEELLLEDARARGHTELLRAFRSE